MTESKTLDIEVIQQKIQQESGFVDRLLAEVGRVIVGQKTMVERLLIGLLADGHVLMEGVPGLAKTLLIKTVAQILDLKFSRIQFTPDLLPADVVGTLIYNMKLNDFSIKKGPIFANFVLADEINRAPAKVQSALLEAMQEKQVTIGDETFVLDKPFLVMASMCSCQTSIAHTSFPASPSNAAYTDPIAPVPTTAIFIFSTPCVLP